MGVKISVTKQELYPPGDYLLVIQGNEVAKTSNKIKIKLVIASGPYAGRTVSRNFNPTLSAMSDLGKLLSACGVQLEGATNGQNLDLDIINNVKVAATLVHYTMPNGTGTINSLNNFRRVDPASVAQFAPPVTAAYTPPQSFAPVTAAPAAQPVPAAAPAFQPVPTAQPVPTGPKIAF